MLIDVFVACFVVLKALDVTGGSLAEVLSSFGCLPCDHDASEHARMRTKTELPLTCRRRRRRGHVYLPAFAMEELYWLEVQPERKG